MTLNGTIFLNSCLNGHGKEFKDNLANYFIRNLPGKKIYSSQDSFRAQNVVIFNEYPLDLKILIFKRQGYLIRDNDINATYTNNFGIGLGFIYNFRDNNQTNNNSY